MYYGSIPSSSIAAERAFAKGRCIYCPTRRKMTNERLKAEIINSANSELLDEMTNKLYNKAAPIPVTSFSPINNNTSNNNNSGIDLTSNYINYIYDSDDNDDDDSEYLDLWSMEIPNTTNIDTPIAVPATNNNYITNRITPNTNNNNNNRLLLNNQITSNSHNSTSSNNRK